MCFDVVSLFSLVLNIRVLVLNILSSLLTDFRDAIDVSVLGVCAAHVVTPEER